MDDGDHQQVDVEIIKATIHRTIYHLITLQLTLIPSRIDTNTMAIPRRKIIKACKSKGYMIEPAAVEAMHQYLNSANDDGKDALEDLLMELEQHLQKHNNNMISEQLWKHVIDEEEEANNVSTTHLDINDNSASDGDVEVVSAFQTPRLVYDSMRKAFRVEEKQKSLLGSAADKVCEIFIKSRIYAFSNMQIFGLLQSGFFVDVAIVLVFVVVVFTHDIVIDFTCVTDQYVVTKVCFSPSTVTKT